MKNNQKVGKKKAFTAPIISCALHTGIVYCSSKDFLLAPFMLLRTSFLSF